MLCISVLYADRPLKGKDPVSRNRDVYPVFCNSRQLPGIRVLNNNILFKPFFPRNWHFASQFRSSLFDIIFWTERSWRSLPESCFDNRCFSPRGNFRSEFGLYGRTFPSGPSFSRASLNVLSHSGILCSKPRSWLSSRLYVYRVH